MKGLIASVVGLPLLTSAVTALLRHRQQTARSVTLAAVACTALCATILTFHPEIPSLTIPEWLPAAGSMNLSANASGLYAALALTLGLFLALLYAPIPPLTNSVLLLGLGGANAALLADHFLLRYVALEIVALCILLAPIAEGSTGALDRSARGGYLLLRLGDAGLLAAIPVLWHAAGTLHIEAALEAGKTLDAAQLGWVTAGLALAVWVKVGAWPFHLWSQTGRRLSPASHAWLYSTAVPNLGLYLLYRITPLLAHAGPLRTVLLWIGSAGALLSALLALIQLYPRTALVYIGAVQGGLLLLIAAAGTKSAVWLGLLALTPLRLLLFLATQTARDAGSIRSQRMAAALAATGGLGLAAFSLVTLWWARAHTPAIALFAGQIAAALAGAWALGIGLQTRGDTTPVMKPRRLGWVCMGILAAISLAGGLAFGPLIDFAAEVTHTTPPATPTLQTLGTSLPAVVTAAVLAIGIRQLHRWAAPTISTHRTEQKMRESEPGLTRAATAVHAAIEINILERTTARIKQIVMAGSRLVWHVEHGILERSLNTLVHGVAGGASIVYRVIEQEGLEGILHHTVRAALALSKQAQRWHTGRLRRNLLWVPIALMLALLALMVMGGNG